MARGKKGPDKLIGSLQVDIKEGEEAYSVSKTAHAEMVSRGISLPERPAFPSSHEFIGEDGSPKIPFDLQDLSEQELGQLYWILNAWYAYVVGQWALVENQYTVAKEQFKLVASRVRIGKEGRVQDKTDRQITDRRYVMANARAIELKCLFNLLSKVKDKCDAEIKMVSRAITLREQKIKTGARAGAIRARKRIASDFDDPPHYTETEEEQEQPVPRVRKRKPPRKRPASKRWKR